MSVRFDSVEAAEKCIKLMNKRWFSGRQISYVFRSLREQRLQDWGKLSRE